MKKEYRFSIVMFLVMLACTNDNRNDTSINSNGQVDSLTTEMLRKFNLQLSECSSIDSNSLIFFCSRNVDTSSFLHFFKKGTQVFGNYSTVIPTYHLYLNDYADSNNLIFSEGYSFTIDSSKWKQITDRATLVLNSQGNYRPTLHYFDGNYYGLLYNGKNAIGDMKNADTFENFYLFIRDRLLHSLYEKRRPKIIQGKVPSVNDF